MATLTIEETIAFVEKLIASGRGDSGRLGHVLIMLKQGRKLYHSDQKYLDGKLAQEIGLEQKPKIEETLLTRIQNLISEGRGDVGRLQFILESLTQGKTIYHSDQKYLEGKLGHKIDQRDIIPKQDDTKTIEGLKSQIVSANQKITHLESVLSGKVSQLQKIQDNPTQKMMVRTPGAMPKGWKPLSVTEELNKVQQQISIEQVKLDKEKSESERLRIEQSKLMQIILDRKEFEKQVKIEQEQLAKQIEQE
ncbi:MAG TPA: hypothetical protein VD828_03850, partial [Candidatus Nitrosotenuis sp.]|nr:hypothetical protein [Candidatus Nitrosotenuis sp.]